MRSARRPKSCRDGRFFLRILLRPTAAMLPVRPPSGHRRLCRAVQTSHRHSKAVSSRHPERPDLISPTRRGLMPAPAAQPSACWRYAGHDRRACAPPIAGSPRRLWCSRMSFERRFGLVRGIGDTEPTITLTSPASEMPSMPTRACDRDRGSVYRPREPFPLAETRAAIQTSSRTAARIDGLQYELQIKAQLQFRRSRPRADSRRSGRPRSQPFNLALDDVNLLFEKAFDGR